MMKRLRFVGNRRVELEEVEVPRPGPGEVLIRVWASALCGSEMGAFRASQGMPGNPGHELVGEIVDACRHPDLREGQRVAVHVVVSCGKCYWCLRGQELYCPAVHGLNNAHAEYLAAPASHCLPIPDDVDWETALLIGGDTMGVGYRASTRAGVRAGEVAAVVGAGPVGLGHVVLLSFWGLQVIAVDPRPYRRALAQQLGAAEALAPDAEAVAVLRRYNDGRGPDFVFDCAGSPQALGLSVQAVRPGGTVAIIGERGETPIYPSRDIIHREIQLFGSWYFARYQFYEQVELVRRGMQPRRLITHRLPLEAAQEAYELMDAGECGKIIFTYS